ncbi:hypothetical protein BH18ACT1_BH18ACT1_18330 [soil metagenome]|nr:hypothetical protein [Acidimicrobiia bacterium]
MTPTGHLSCPYCAAYGVRRLFLAGLDLDACECGTCGARWDERRSDGAFVGRGTRTTVLAPRRLG